MARAASDTPAEPTARWPRAEASTEGVTAVASLAYERGQAPARPAGRASARRARRRLSVLSHATSAKRTEHELSPRPVRADGFRAPHHGESPTSRPGCRP